MKHPSLLQVLLKKGHRKLMNFFFHLPASNRRQAQVETELIWLAFVGLLDAFLRAMDARVALSQSIMA